jgi:protein arginine N-methyltransferase 1
MYSLAGYGAMLADRVRIEAYAEALRRMVKPGSVVMDIGTGPGIWAVLACRLGAKRVIAIEPDSSIQLAREIASRNRCGDRIEFIERLSTRVDRPIQADVIISDLRGVLPQFDKNIPSVVDARRRFLAPGGTLIARKDMVWSAVVEAPQTYNEYVDCWENNLLKQDLGPARRRAANTPQKVRAKAEQLLTTPKLWTTVDYQTIEDPDAKGTLEWVAKRSGTGHGILVWFDTELAEDIGFSNAPGAPETIYWPLFFPWPNPISLTAGQRVRVSLVANLVEDDYVWRWTTHIEPTTAAGEPVDFEQSSLEGDVLSLEAIRKQASDYVPHLSEDGRIERRTLELMDGGTSLEDIARQLATEFPSRFTRWQQALSHAGVVSQKLGE